MVPKKVQHFNNTKNEILLMNSKIKITTKNVRNNKCDMINIK